MRGLSARLAVALLALPPLFAFGSMSQFRLHNRNNGSLISSGEKREYLLYVPHSYDASKPTPLVISLHGAGGWPAHQRDLTQWNRVADRERLIVVYPSAYEGSGPRIWRAQLGAESAKDVRFISDLIDALAGQYNIDRTRIYVNGFSNGGGMSFVLSCRLAERIAAVGAVAAAESVPFSWCRSEVPVPVIAFHGELDPLVPYRGGLTWVTPRNFPDVTQWAEKWSKRNRCLSRSEENIGRISRMTYTRCAAGADVVLYALHDGGHIWPGGGTLPEWFAGPHSTQIDASATMWQFFRAHPLQSQTSRVAYDASPRVSFARTKANADARGTR